MILMPCVCARARAHVAATLLLVLAGNGKWYETELAGRGGAAYHTQMGTITLASCLSAEYLASGRSPHRCAVSRRL